MYYNLIIYDNNGIMHLHPIIYFLLKSMVITFSNNLLHVTIKTKLLYPSFIFIMSYDFILNLTLNDDNVNYKLFVILIKITLII